MNLIRKYKLYKNFNILDSNLNFIFDILDYYLTDLIIYENENIYPVCKYYFKKNELVLVDDKTLSYVDIRYRNCIDLILEHSHNIDRKEIIDLIEYILLRYDIKKPISIYGLVEHNFYVEKVFKNDSNR